MPSTGATIETKQKYAKLMAILLLTHYSHYRNWKMSFSLQWFAAVTIQAAWRGHLVRSQLPRQLAEQWDPQRNLAATVIQVIKTT